MLKNYFKIAWRNLINHKSYALINISGLAIGVACCILIFTFIRNEWQYDRFHTNIDRIYRIINQETTPDGSLYFRILQPPGTAPELADAFPSIEKITRLTSTGFRIEHGSDVYQESFFYADSSIFDIFTLPFLAGDPGVALLEPGSMVINRRIAEKYFGDTPPSDIIGRSLQIQDDDIEEVFTITGVMEAMPVQTSLELEILIPYTRYPDFGTGSNSWGGRASTYILLAENQDPSALEQALKPFTAQHFANLIDGRRSGGYLAEGEDAFQLVLEPMSAVHFTPETAGSYETATHNPLYSYILAAIAALVLLIACINFMTLSVGRSASRAQEVGLRKVLGAQRAQLMKQFWGEAVLMSGLAVVLGLALAQLSIPLFNELTGRELQVPYTVGIEFLLFLLGLALVIGLLAGSYPALILSGFRPIAALRGEQSTGGKNRLTRSLVVAQYALAIALMVSAGVMKQQLDYLRNKPLGFDAEQVIVVDTNDRSDQSVPKVNALKSALAGYPDILSVSGSGYSFTRGSDNVSWQEPDGTPRLAHRFRADFEFASTLGLEIVEGRDFSREFATDPEQAVLVNESLVKSFGLAEPIGARLLGYGPSDSEPPTIVGVVQDFHFKSLHEAILPAFLHINPNWSFGTMLIRIKPERVPETIEQIRKQWASISPDTPFSYYFLDEDVQQQYVEEERWSRIIIYSTLFALLIACMGLFGLTALAVSKRTKEIGIRKVLGASVPTLVVLVSRQFITLVALATLVAWPLAYFGMTRWLESFAYSISISWPVFILTGLIALMIAWITVSFLSIKAAMGNPVNALRYE